MNQLSSSVTKISPNMQTYIPKIVKNKLNLLPTASIEWLICNDSVTIKKVETPQTIINNIYGIGKKTYKKYGGGEKWLKEERKAWEK